MPKDYKKKAKDFYESKEDMFEGVREVGRAITKVTKSAAQVIAEKLPTFASPPTAEASRIERVTRPEGGWAGESDMTPNTRMNNPKKYKNK